MGRGRRERGRTAVPWTRVGLALALTAAVFTSRRADAYCRAVTATPPAGYDPTQEGCFGSQGGGYLTLYWSNACVGYSINQSASLQVTLAQATTVAAEAFATWSNASCGAGAASIAAVDEGPVQCDLVQYNEDGPNQHVIVFRDDGWPYDDSSNTLGLTTLTYVADTGAIVDADVEINSHDFALVAEGPVPAGAYDLASVLTHEAGHFLGLAHSDQSAAVMYAHYAPGSAALTPDDVAGVCAIDPAGGTRVTSAGPVPAAACNPTPQGGFTTYCAGAGPATSPAPASSTHSCSASVGVTSPGGSALFAVAILALIGARRRGRRGPRLAPLTMLLGASGVGCVGDDSNTAAPVATDASAPSIDASLGAADAAPPPLPFAWVRLAHWSPDAPAVDFCLALHGTGDFGSPLVATQSRALDAGSAALTYPEVTAYFATAPGRYDARAVVAGAPDCTTPVVPDLTSLGAWAVGAFATVALEGDSSGAPARALAAYADDGVGAGSVALRFVNAAPALARADFGTGAAGASFKPFVQGVAFGATGTPTDGGAPEGGVTVDSRGYALVPALSGATVSAHATGASIDAVVATGVDVAPGAVVTATLLAVPDAVDGGPAFQLLECVDNAGTVGMLGACTVLPQ